MKRRRLPNIGISDIKIRYSHHSLTLKVRSSYHHNGNSYSWKDFTLKRDPDGETVSWLLHYIACWFDNVSQREGVIVSRSFSRSPPGQNGLQFGRRHFQIHFLEWNNENNRIVIQISLKSVPMGPTDNMPALIQVMARRRTGDKPLTEPMLTHFTDAYIRH